MGYDLNRFVTKVDEEFICPICSMVLENGVQSQHCEHTYCDACIKEWLIVNSNCPVDRKQLKLENIKPVPRILKNLINKFEIKCDFEAQGCPSISKLENLHSHTKECLFNPKLQIMCSRECRLEMTQKEYEYHNCVTKLSSLVLSLQKQVTKLENELCELRKDHSWISPNGLIVNHNIIECIREVVGNDDYKTFIYGYPFAQSKYPLTEQNPSIEIEILDFGLKNFLVIVLTPCYKSINDLSNDVIELFGYTSYGTVFVKKKNARGIGEKDDLKWEKGDRITVGIVFEKSDEEIVDEIMVYFKRNNELVYEKKLLKTDIGFYPTFYTTSVGAKIIINSTLY